VRDTCLALCEEMARRCIADRAALPAAQQLDVYYDDTNRDWQGQLRRVLDFAGLPWTAQGEQAMALWLARSQRENRHGAHRYACEDYLVSREEIDARLGFYRDHYAVPVEQR